MRNMLISKFDLCTGCRTCQLICSYAHEGGFNTRYARLHVFSSPDGLFSDVQVCAQCDNPACMRVCPREGAVTRDSETRAMIIHRDRCTGCGLCIKYCHRSVIIKRPDDGKAAKCDLCGGDPQCVAYCPAGALSLVAVEEVEADAI